MELALYDPDHGYYSRRPDRGARSGDFLTAPEMHPIFGRALARQLEEMWERLGRPDRFRLVEHGAGSGVLAVSVLAALRASGPGLLRALRYRPVEVSRDRLAAVKETVERAGFGAHLEPTGEVERRVTGCILANEFLDALPVHRLVWRGGRLREIHTIWRDGWFADEEGDPSRPDLATPLPLDRLGLVEGQLLEVRPAAPAWLRRVAGELERGYVVVIDYGADTADLYGSRRRRGTLLGYRGHHVSHDPYAFVGRQDLTAHVDFGALRDAALECGLSVLGRTSQAEFLAGLGMGALLVAEREAAESDGDLAAYLAARSAVGRLLDPAALGRFQVLLLGRGVPAEPPLAGLSFRLEPRAARA